MLLNGAAGPDDGLWGLNARLVLGWTEGPSLVDYKNKREFV